MDEKNIVEEQNIIPEEKPVTPSVDTVLLARWVRVLFWLIIASLLISFLTGETISETMPVVTAAAQIANILVVAFTDSYCSKCLLKRSGTAVRQSVILFQRLSASRCSRYLRTWRIRWLSSRLFSRL